MLTLAGYHIIGKLIENKSWTLYKAIFMKDDKVVAIKHMHKESKQRNMEIVHEYHVTRNLTGNHVLRPIRLERKGKEAFLVTEMFSGTTLEDQLKTSFFDVKSFLKIASGITRIVALIHQEDIIHKSLHPRNILLNLNEAEIKITDFHQATTLSSEMQYPNKSPFQLKENVAYMSPEQTGRMNRVLDYRTDIYSLGIIFYEMLTGKRPFKEEHPAEMIYSHLAKKPLHPEELNPEIPSIVADIIMNMLEKVPESRYQSLFRLKADLDKCLHLLNETGKIIPFRLKEKDKAMIYEKPSKLYGRAGAVKLLMDGFQRVHREGTELILIPGPSGIGKTALVSEIHKPLIREKGYFISGKFVQLQKQTPYAPLIHAFQELIRQILSEGAESIRKWGETVKLELGSQTSVIANFIPEISWLIGSQPDLPPLPPQGVHNRFRHAVRKFVGIFARKAHPLVLFLDDLQWADAATLDLIEYLVSNAENQYAFIIGAYRDNEIHVGHPLDGMLKSLKDKEVHVKQISIDRLSISHINEWIDDTLAISSEDAAFLGDLVYRVTEGNPFFTVQLFQSFYEEKIITFLPDEGRWQVHMAKLNQIPIPDTILDFILIRINKLPKETKEILQLASCFGNQFDLKSLSAISAKRFDELALSLWHGLKEGLILPMDASYKWVYPNEDMSFLEAQSPGYMFLHDKVQQAFYISLPQQNRNLFHLNIGMELVNHYDQNQLEENIFEIVNHLNHCRKLLSKEQTMNLAEWNGIAGEKAKERAASEAALHFYHQGNELLADERWKHYDITFKMMTGLGEAQYLNQLFDEAEITFDEALAHAKSNQDKLRIYNLKVTLYTHIHQVEKAVSAGLEGLRLFNWNFRKNPGKSDVAKEYLLTKLVLQQKKNADLLKLQAVTDKDARLLMRTLINLNAPTYHVNQKLATILMLRALRLTLKYGDMDVTALVYNNYALTMSAGFQNYDASYRYGELAISHTDKFGNNSLKARVYFVLGSFVNHWKKPIQYNIEYLERSQQLCIESGNLHLASAGSAFIGLTLFIKGENLQDVKRGIERQLDFAKKNEYAISNDFLGEVMNWIDVLSKSDSTVNWKFPSFTDDPSAAIIHYTIRLQMTYLLQNETEAVMIMERLESLVDDTLILVIAPDSYFYHALWLARLIQTGKLPKRAGRVKLLKKLRKLEKWAEHSPTNYKHKYLLVKGEMARGDGKDEEAVQCYHQAAILAERHGFLQDTAIANSCAADFYLDKNLPKSAKAYLVDAYLTYLKWGADRIAYQIHQNYSEVITDQKQESAMALEKESLDINAVAEASGIISGEVVLNQLVMKLMYLVVTNTGAEWAHLLLQKEDGLQLVATNYSNEDITIYDQPENLNHHMNFANTIVNYVFHTREAVVLGEAFKEGEFTKDDYIMGNQARSILCLPIVYQGKLTGILYLENNQSTYVFTKERILLLNILASQAAISIENAYLYANLEAKVEERTKLLNEANQNLTMANESLAHSEHLRRQMLSNISHDLRSPIATIQGYIDAIFDGLVESPEQQQHYLAVIRKRLTSLNSLVQDLFDIAQFESGTARLSMDVIPVDQLFTHLCSQFELDIKQAGLDYEWHLSAYDQKSYPLVEADVKRIEQVMGNLVSNAVKHTNKGKIKIRLDFGEKEEVIFSVEDQGIGIAASEIPYVFDRFFTKNKGGKQGSGLGLAISKEIIAGHNGKIWVTSNETKGSTFSFSLKTYQ